MFRSVLIAVCAVAMSGCAAERAALPVVPPDQRISDRAAALMGETCRSNPGVPIAKAPAWCQCIEDQARTSISRVDADRMLAVLKQPGITTDSAAAEAAADAAPVLRLIRAECIRRVQPL